MAMPGGNGQESYDCVTKPSALAGRPGIHPASKQGMQMHSFSKEQREAVRQLVHLVLLRDMGTFTPQRFKDWIKEMDQKFRKVGLTLGFAVNDRVVNFTIREIRTRRTVFHFSSSTRVPFDDRDVVMSVDQISLYGS